MTSKIEAMQYKLLPLTLEETNRGGKCLGLTFAMANKDRWVDISYAPYELQTYDRGFSNVVYKDKVYMIHRDFIFVEEGIRLYIGKFYDMAEDRLPEV